jgi:hypothetical protein
VRAASAKFRQTQWRGPCSVDVVRLPRSNLVKSKSSHVAPTASPFDRTVAGIGAPVPVFIAPPTPAPFLPDRTVPLAFGAFAAPAAAPVSVGESTLREPLNTNLDGVEVPRGPYPSAISTHELLQRAAALGPARMTWESIVLPADPILDEKQQPHVAERRQRFTRMVKVGLGACLAVCVVALGVSALSGNASASSSSAASSEALGKTIPSKGIVPVEALDATIHAKLARRTPPTAAIVRPKRR